METINVTPSLTSVPFSEDAERAVIGAALMGGTDIARLIRLEPVHFYLLRNSYIWEAIQRLLKSKLDVDYLSVQDELTATGKLADIGGPAYLTTVMNATVDTMNAETYAALVYRTSLRRMALLMADEIKGLALDESLPVEQVVSGASNRIAILQRATGEIVPTQSLSDMIADYEAFVEERAQNPELLLGLPSGYKDLDEITMGWQSPNLYIVAGATGMGKTALCINFCLHALRLGLRVGFFTREMSKAQILHRLVALETGIDSQKITAAKISTESINGRASEWSRVLEANERIQHFPLLLDDQIATIGGVKNKAAQWQSEGGLDLIIGDYVQLFQDDATGGKASREEIVGNVAYGFKDIAKTLNIPVMAAAQVNRAMEDRKEKRPALSDLRESGRLEQAADAVMFVYRDAYYNPETEFPNGAEIIIAKHRNGPTGTILLHFEKTIMKFSDSSTSHVDLSNL